MLPKTRRLSHHDFVLLKQIGHTLRSPNFSLVYADGASRVAVVTSAKLHKHAVVRNRLRRQVYNHLRTHVLPFDLIIYPFPPVLKLSYAQLSLTLDSLLSKLASG